MCAYNDTSGIPENGVSVSAKLVPGSGANLQGDIVDLEQNQLRRSSSCKRSTASATPRARRSSPAATSSLLVVFAGPYQLQIAAGPNQTIEQVEQLAREILPKLAAELAARWAQ